MSLRKEVFLEASGAIWAGFMAVGRLSNLDIPAEEITAGYVDKSPAIAKIHIVAQHETMKAVINLSGELTTSLFRLMGKRFLLIQQREQLESHKDEADHGQRAFAFYREQLNFVEEGFNEQKRLERFLIPVVCCARNELDMRIDAEEYEKSLKAGSDKAIDALKKFREQLGA